MILCLPGETKESFLDGITKVLDAGVRDIVIYTLVKLEGTPLATDEFVEKYDYITRYRLVPRDFSDIRGTKVFEIEIAIIGNNTMSEEDYFELRDYAFTISSYTSSLEFAELKRFLFNLGIKISSWVYNIHARINKTPGTSDCYKNFMKETKSELFRTREALVEYYSRNRNYSKLISGELGDNLVRKYRFQLLNQHYSNSLKLAIDEAKKLTTPVLGTEKAEAILDSFHTYLSSRNLGSIMDGRNIESKEHLLNFDIPGWINNKDQGLSLDKLEGAFRYKTVYSEYSKKVLKQYKVQYKDPELSFQMIYRDGISVDLWPQWISAI